MSNELTIGGGESAVVISGLSGVDEVTEAAFDGITVTLTGAAVDNFSELLVLGGAADQKNGVRRIIWNGKVDGVERSTVLIVDLSNGSLRGGWLLFGEAQNALTYYPDSSKLTADSTGSIEDDDAAIMLHFVDKKTALTPRTFTFMEKYSLLSLGSSFDHVTIDAGNRSDVYLSRSLENSTKISGVIKRGSKASADGGEWKFSDPASFAVETENNAVKFFNGRNL